MNKHTSSYHFSLLENPSKCPICETNPDGKPTFISGVTFKNPTLLTVTLDLQHKNVPVLSFPRPSITSYPFSPIVSSSFFPVSRTTVTVGKVLGFAFRTMVHCFPIRLTALTWHPEAALSSLGRKQNEREKKTKKQPTSPSLK